MFISHPLYCRIKIVQYSMTLVEKKINNPLTLQSNLRCSVRINNTHTHTHTSKSYHGINGKRYTAIAAAENKTQAAGKRASHPATARATSRAAGGRLSRDIQGFKQYMFQSVVLPTRCEDVNNKTVITKIITTNSRLLLEMQ